MGIWIGHLNKMKKVIYRYLREFGIDFRKTLVAIKEISRYRSNLRKFRKFTNAEWRIKNTFPCLHDRCDESGSAKGPYFHQDLLVAQKIFENHPSRHVDVGSRVDGLVSHVAVFRKIEVFDIRPLDSEHGNIAFKRMDLMKLQKKYENYTDSLSCLHALEHFGLGRYGDDLDIYGYKKGFENLSKMLKKGGIFYFSVPIGEQRIEFDAHRVFSLKSIFDLAEKNNLKVIKFSYVDDNGNLHKDYTLKDEDLKNNLNCSFGCGIWEFAKR